MAKIEIKGIIPAMVTPFTKNGEIDIAGLRKLTRWLIESHVDGLCPLGSTGEGPKLSREERMKVLKVVLDEVGGSAPVTPATGGMTTRDAIAYTGDARELGAQAALITPPWYYHPSPKALLEHYRTIAEKVDFPIILYNLPSLAGYPIPAEIVVELAELDNIVGLKDSSGDMLYYQALLNQVPDEFDIMQGYGSLFLPSLILGAKTTVCGLGNIAPRILVNMYRSYLDGNHREARDLHFKLVTLESVAEYGTFPVGIKEAMNMLGLPGGYALRPSSSLNKQERNRIEDSLKRAGLSS